MAKRGLICGVAINDADYVVKWRETVVNTDGTTKTKHVACKIYEIWKDMIYRCFSERYKQLRPTYRDVTCCDSWLNYKIDQVKSLKSVIGNDRAYNVLLNRYYNRLELLD
jgi:hypothetical protein